MKEIDCWLREFRANIVPHNNEGSIKMTLLTKRMPLVKVMEILEEFKRYLIQQEMSVVVTRTEEFIKLTVKE